MIIDIALRRPKVSIRKDTVLTLQGSQFVDLDGEWRSVGIGR